MTFSTRWTSRGFVNRGWANRAAFAGVAALLASFAAAPAIAQSQGEEARLRKIEAEVRALQRSVFPGGSGRFFEPQISGAAEGAGTPAATSTTAVTDILIRLDGLEAQIAALTAQTEENTNTLSLMRTRVVALEAGRMTSPTGTVEETPVVAVTRPAATSVTSPGATTVAPTTTTAVVTGPTAERIAAVSQIAKPQTDDAGDDEYSYGYRLWNAGFFPEAQQQLTLFVEKYPSHSRATYGRNLLGRAYLDDGKPNEAAPWFLKNYQEGRNDRRAADSLLYLGETMIAIDDSARACIALAEFGETYPAVASGRLADQYQAALRKVDCN